MDTNNTDNNSENNNPYDNADYSNPNFPKNPNINSGDRTNWQGENAQNSYNQNPYYQSNGQRQNSYNQNPYYQSNGQGQNSYNQNPYSQPDRQGQYGQTNGYNQYGQYPANPSNGQPNGNAKRPATGMEVASLILGIISLTCCAGTGIFAIIGLILLAVSKGKTKTYSGVGIGGLVCCILGLITGIIVIVILVGTGFLAYYMETGQVRDFLLLYLL